MRTGRVILGEVVLLWAFLQAPFDHIHPLELEHETTSTPAHIHAPETPAEHGPSLSAYSDDDNEIDVLWSAATSPRIALHAVAEITEPLSVAVPAFGSALVLVARHRGHDPPQFSPKIPRAPPA